jgi:hypothetical protein
MNGNLFSAYGINHMFLLGLLQYNGLGYDNAKSLVCGFLGLCSPFLKARYHQLELQVVEKEAKGKYRNKTDHLPMYKMAVALIGQFLTQETL